MQRECSESGEFSLIRNIERLFCDIVPEGVMGIGDDCAVFEGSDGVATVVTKDMLLEGVHFTREMTPWEIGVRSVQVNISDVAAMGARPTALFLGLGVPEGLPLGWCKEFAEGVRSCGVPLLGGDTTSSRSGVVISVTAMGSVRSTNIKLRSAAMPSDVIMVTGALGGSALFGYRKPVEARVEQGVWLGERSEVHAMMDLSDGLSGDLPHILEQSGVGAVVNLDKIPLFTGATLEQGLSGGEDYELLLTVEKERAERLKADYRARFCTELLEVGSITTVMGLEYRECNEVKELNINGFRHF
ncbi:MAG: thiamine-phosphate kinase [Rikenellaceae bacterium]